MKTFNIPPSKNRTHSGFYHHSYNIQHEFVGSGGADAADGRGAGRARAARAAAAAGRGRAGLGRAGAHGHPRHAAGKHALLYYFNI